MKLANIFRYFLATIFLLASLTIIYGQKENNIPKKCYYDLTNSGITKNDEILNLHNQIRKNVSEGKVAKQSKGINIKNLKWDTQLAQRALDVAKVCLFRHLRVNDTRFRTGQNLHIVCANRSNPRLNWKPVLNNWFREYSKYTYPQATADAFNKAGHYTQIIWADTQFVGCAYSLFEISVNSEAPQDDFTQKVAQKGMKVCRLYVCNYGPEGNILGKRPYET